MLQKNLLLTLTLSQKVVKFRIKKLLHVHFALKIVTFTVYIHVTASSASCFHLNVKEIL